MQAASEVHEIIPRARTKQSIYLPKNRVPLCSACHRVQHKLGVNAERMKMLREVAEMRLKSFGEDLGNW